MKVSKTSYEPHPEGWFLFCVGKPEEVDAEWNGKVRKRLKWPCESTERMEDGSRFVLNLFTGVNVSDYPTDKHRLFVENGFSIKSEEYEDTDELVGRIFAGKVGRNAKGDKLEIIQFDTRDRVKSSKAATKPKAKPETEFNDPFADE